MDIEQSSLIPKIDVMDVPLLSLQPQHHPQQLLLPSYQQVETSESHSSLDHEVEVSEFHQHYEHQQQMQEHPHHQHQHEEESYEQQRLQQQQQQQHLQEQLQQQQRQQMMHVPPSEYLAHHMRAAEGIVQRCHERGGLLPMLMKDHPEEPEFLDATTLINWKQAMRAKDFHTCPPEVIQYLDKELPTWKDTTNKNITSSAMQKAEGIVQRYLARGKLLPRDLRGGGNVDEVTRKQESRDSAKLNYWKLALKSPQSSHKCPAVVKHYLDTHMPGWTEKVRSINKEPMDFALDIVSRYIARGNVLPRELKNRNGDPVREEEYRDATKLRNWKKALRGSGTHMCSEQLTQFLDMHMPGWRKPKADKVHQPLQFARDIVARVKERQGALPRELKETRNDPARIQEYKDACKLNNWKKSLRGIGTHQCAEHIQAYLDEHIPTWRNRGGAGGGRKRAREGESAGRGGRRAKVGEQQQQQQQQSQLDQQQQLQQQQQQQQQQLHQQQQHQQLQHEQQQQQLQLEHQQLQQHQQLHQQQQHQQLRHEQQQHQQLQHDQQQQQLQHERQRQQLQHEQQRQQHQQHQHGQQSQLHQHEQQERHVLMGGDGEERGLLELASMEAADLTLPQGLLQSSSSSHAQSMMGERAGSHSPISMEGAGNSMAGPGGGGMGDEEEEDLAEEDLVSVLTAQI